MSKTSFLFGVHCHQPVDNFDHVVSHAIAKSYRPLFETLSRYDSLKTAVHFSGWLFSFIKDREPSLFRLMQKCHEKGSLEFFTGGFYEPILAAIPRKDRVGQIKMLNSFLLNNFGAKPKGLWLTERVWESAIIPDLSECGVEYAIVDDYHFLAAGMHKDKLKGSFLTEQDGCKLTLFPINKDLRYAIPFRSADKAVEMIRECGDDDDSAAILFDDGEKFGLWPKTYEWVYEKGWLEQFCEAVTENENIQSVHFSDYAATHKPRALAYLPTVSYYEMGEWSLPSDAAVQLETLRERLVAEGFGDQVDRFVKGGVWKNFFSKYSESNHLHKRTIELSTKVKTDAPKELIDALYRSQSNDALWHGVFGGLYLPCLRNAVYKYVVKCENELEKLGLQSSCEASDINFDGHKEVKLSSKQLICVFASKDGAKLVELDDRSLLFNYQSTLTRRKELYHEKILHPDLRHTENDDGIDTIHTMRIDQTQELEKLLHFDWYTKGSFVDLFVGSDFSPQTFMTNSFAEFGDFADQPFELLESGCGNTLFRRCGGLYADGVKYDVTLEKSFSLHDSTLGFKSLAESKNIESSGRIFDYACEWNIHFAEPNAVRFNGAALIDPMAFEDDLLEIDDASMGRTIAIRLDRSAKWYLYWHSTVSQSETGFDVTIQGVSIAACVRYGESNGAHTLLAGTLTIKD